MDVSQALKATENSLRDIFSYMLQEKFGSVWLTKIGVSGDRVTSWESRQTEEQARLGRSDPRVIYYADFYDLKTILRKNWENGLSDVFSSELREVEVLLKLLEEFRNPDAHRRELLPYEAQLVLGITGKIRSQISMFYNKMQQSNSYFCRIESIQDNLGNSWSPSICKKNQPNRLIRPGQRLEFTVVASDPQGQPILYAAYENLSPFKFEWKEFGYFAFEILEEHINEAFVFSLAVKSHRPYAATSHHVFGKCDQYVPISYTVLPRLER